MRNFANTTEPTEMGGKRILAFGGGHQSEQGTGWRCTGKGGLLLRCVSRSFALKAEQRRVKMRIQRELGRDEEAKEKMQNGERKQSEIPMKKFCLSL